MIVNSVDELLDLGKIAKLLRDDAQARNIASKLKRGASPTLSGYELLRMLGIDEAILVILLKRMCDIEFLDFDRGGSPLDRRYWLSAYAHKLTELGCI